VPETLLSARAERFRAEVRAFFAGERVRLALDELRRLPPRQEPGLHEVYRWLGERGWLAANWPEEYGGLGLGAVEAAVVSEEMALAGVPDLTHVLSIDIVGLFLLLVGTPAQKRRYLPPLARGEEAATVLYTEPAVGSDLSSLRSRAEADGDGWRLHGRKVYSQKSQFAAHALCAVRTGPEGSGAQGITLFMVPMRAEGVRVEPIWNLSNERFDDVRLEGVRVTSDEMVGPLDQGWQVVNAVLSLERTGIDYQARIRRWLDVLMARARARGFLEDPRYSQQLVSLDAQLKAGRLLAWRVVESIDRGELDEVASATSKWFNTELGRQVARLALEVEGLDAALSRWDPEAPAAGLLEAAYRESPGLTISAGTSEIMLYLVASSGLGIFG
jgi:alkylation response protein AidB-like acyl-CoA dehydrogenase